MDAATVFTLIEKGLTLLPLLIEAGGDVYTTINNLKQLSAAGAAGTVTDEQLAAIEADIDAKLADFNADIP